MSKELEPIDALDKLLDGYSKGMAGRSYYDIVREALQRLEEIDNANISEVLECLECLYCVPDDYRSNDRAKDYETIKQALLKAEKYEKIILGIEDYLNRRIEVEPLEDARKAFIEIRNQLQVIKEVLE